MESLISLSVDEQKEHIMNCQSNMILSEPYNHLMQNSGKKFRSKIVEAFNCCLNVPEHLMVAIADIVQQCHSMCLLIDDIQDNSILRRGIPAAHTIFGIGRTIAAFDVISYQYEEKVFELENAKITGISENTMFVALKGQIMDTYWRDNFICPSEEEYLDMVTKKTGELLKSICQLYELLISRAGQFENLALYLGIYFQIKDDYKNLTSKEYFDTKGFCEDITEGKFSFPIIHAIRSRPDDKRVLNILKLRPTDIVVKKQCLELLEEFGSFEYTKSKLEHYYEMVKQETFKLGLAIPFQTIDIASSL